MTYVVQAFRPAAPRAGRAEALHYVSGAAPVEAPSGMNRGKGLSFFASFAAFAFLVVAAPASAQSVARFSLESVVAADGADGENMSHRPQVVVDVSLAVRIGDRWQAYVRPWFRLPRPSTATAPAPEWNKEIYQAGLRYERPGEVSTRIDLGYILSPIGLGVFDTRPGVNPTIGTHISYVSPMPVFDATGPRVSAVSATYPLGAQASLSTAVWDARAAVINSAPTRTYVLGAADNPRQTPVMVAGAGVTPDDRPARGRVGGARRLRHARRDQHAGVARPQDDDGRRRGRVGVRGNENRCGDPADRVRDEGEPGDRVRVVRPGDAHAVAALVRGGAARRHIRPAARQRPSSERGPASPRSKRLPAFASRRT